MTNDPRPANAFAPPIPIKKSGAFVAIKIVAGIIATLVALLLGLIVLLLIGVETGPIALLIGLVSATLPVPLYLVLVLWIDRYEAEPADHGREGQRRNHEVEAIAEQAPVTDRVYSAATIAE